jgi:hypothetical protein
VNAASNQESPGFIRGEDVNMTHVSVTDLARTSTETHDRIRFAPSVLLTKAEAFGACQALADADRQLLRSGRISEATALGDLFELLEQRLASVTGPN